ncbi:MAG: gas vesicle protein GvpG [Hyphomicrobiales bacterium]
MSILRNVLAAPVLGPIQGLLWLARTIEEQANAEFYDEDKIRGELIELELALDLKQMDLAEYEAREEVLLQRLREIREAKNG